MKASLGKGNPESLINPVGASPADQVKVCLVCTPDQRAWRARYFRVLGEEANPVCPLIADHEVDGNGNGGRAEATEAADKHRSTELVEGDGLAENRELELRLDCIQCRKTTPLCQQSAVCRITLARLALMLGTTMTAKGFLYYSV